MEHASGDGDGRRRKRRRRRRRRRGRIGNQGRQQCRRPRFFFLSSSACDSAASACFPPHLRPGPVPLDQLPRARGGERRLHPRDPSADAEGGVGLSEPEAGSGREVAFADPRDEGERGHAERGSRSRDADPEPPQDGGGEHEAEEHLRARSTDLTEGRRAPFASRFSSSLLFSFGPAFLYFALGPAFASGRAIRGRENGVVDDEGVTS